MRKVILSLLILFGFAFGAAAQDEPVRSIVNVTGDLYRFSEDNTHGVFLVTDEGIILADPINADTATWLKGELDQRFGVPVKFVIYSHDHADHTSGGEVFADTAEFVAQALARPKIEESGHTKSPDRRFPAFLGIELGGKEIGLFYFGASHSDNLIAIHFPAERSVFLVDVATVNRLPYRDLPDYHFPGAIEFLRAIEDLSFKYFIPGHGPIGRKKDIKAHRKYLEDLMAEVEEAIENGLTLEEAKKTIQLEAYKNWGQYKGWRELNIEGMFRILAENKINPGTKILRVATPRYPRNELQMSVTGWVIVDFDISEEGQAENISIFDSNVDNPFENSKAKQKFEENTIEALSKVIFEKGRPQQGIKSFYVFSLGKDEKFDSYFFNYNKYSSKLQSASGQRIYNDLISGGTR